VLIGSWALWSGRSLQHCSFLSLVQIVGCGVFLCLFFFLKFNRLLFPLVHRLKTWFWVISVILLLIFVVCFCLKPFCCVQLKRFLCKGRCAKNYKNLTVLEVPLSGISVNVDAYELNFWFYFGIFNNFLAPFHTFARGEDCFC